MLENEFIHPLSISLMDPIVLIIVPLLMFFFGLCGLFLNRKNILVIIMSIELVLLSVNFLLLVGSVYLDDRVGQLFVLFILSVAAAETSIGLAILVAFYRVKGTVAVAFVNSLRG
jgi:NADH-quinone oxidoreductase subunit K